MPWRSRKQYYPKRFVAVAGASSSPTAPSVIDSSASSSNRPPTRGRKQPRPEHFIPEEAEASSSAKARRSDIALDSFLSCLARGCPASKSEWVKNVTADDS